MPLTAAVGRTDIVGRAGWKTAAYHDRVRRKGKY